MPGKTMDLWRASDGGSPPSPGVARMGNQSSGDLWPVPHEAFEYAALVGCDIEQYRAEATQMIESIETRDFQ